MTEIDLTAANAEIANNANVTSSVKALLAVLSTEIVALKTSPTTDEQDFVALMSRFGLVPRKDGSKYTLGGGEMPIDATDDTDFVAVMSQFGITPRSGYIYLFCEFSFDSEGKFQKVAP